jgi:DNA polymerase III delta subunit
MQLLTGDNSFEIEREVARIVDAFHTVAERIDGSELELRQLPDLLMGATLFATKRLVIIKNLSENKIIWPVFGDWLGRVSDDIQLVLVEPKPDKRTVAYKALQKQADVKEFKVWTERDGSVAESWVMAEAKKVGIALDTKSTHALVTRIGMDQWQLYHGLEKLLLAGDSSVTMIEAIIDARPSENVFNLFDAALRGDRQKVSDMLKTLELTEDPYRLFGLLSGQAFQLAAVAVAAPSDEIAKDFSVHPYAVSKLQAVAKKLGRAGAREVIEAFAKADDDMKISRGEPWLVIERTLLSL